MDMGKSRQERDAGAHWLIAYITKLVGEKRRTGDTVGILAELIDKAVVAMNAANGHPLEPCDNPDCATPRRLRCAAQSS